MMMVTMVQVVRMMDRVSRVKWTTMITPASVLAAAHMTAVASLS